MELGLFQQQNLSLVMTAELRQAIAILQYPCYELSQFLQEQAVENPLIELSESPAFFNNDKKKALQKNKTNQDGDVISMMQPAVVSMHDRLLFQALSIPASDEIGSIIRFLILNIDQAGYLDITEEEVKKRFGISSGTFEKAVDSLHQLEPAGIGARNLRECLLLQLKSLGMEEDLAYRIADNHLDQLAARKLKQIAADLGTTVQAVEQAADFIQTLDPKPGRKLSSHSDLGYLYPDLSVIEDNGTYKLAINDHFTPKVQLNESYAHLLKSKSSGAAQYLQEHYQKLQWLQKSLEQRKNTLIMIAKEIVSAQQNFLKRGPEHLVPMTLREVAERIGMHESTVSRAVKNKVIQTPRGAFELKAFFTAKIETVSGENASSQTAKLAIKKVIEEEDKSRPLSDQAISELLASKKGLSISRRTVAKYREELNIASSSKRKRYS
ncbi:RNA polymerase factor sigma-54 [Fictibacillus terranigra]|uniref:RNA polymerase factor sigma-54 n=1 Tax=Fictibacillus terranigra TaxID=3058424 RepID=A0ABT8E2M3_9BACL|nr:RNA polymerase factor sigma-54 [Fictibacillus sp. CENA-BCM004]MDN4072145.1 RNA polymerase factor sigma-54 [Fictibacillus sp. CENA-BCM004]